MKKALSIVLAMLMIFSTIGVMAFAEEETSDKVTYIFVVDGNTVATAYVDKEITPQDFKNFMPENPVKDATSTTEYIFKGWKLEGGDDTVYYKNEATLPIPSRLPANESGEYTFVAQFAEEEITETQSFWNLIESIFERINMIFAYFAEIFGW